MENAPLTLKEIMGDVWELSVVLCALELAVRQRLHCTKQFAYQRLYILISQECTRRPPVGYELLNELRRDFPGALHGVSVDSVIAAIIERYLRIQRGTSTD